MYGTPKAKYCLIVECTSPVALAAKRIVEYTVIVLVSKSNTSIWTPIRQDYTTFTDFT